MFIHATVHVDHIVNLIYSVQQEEGGYIGPHVNIAIRVINKFAVAVHVQGWAHTVLFTTDHPCKGNVALLSSQYLLLTITHTVNGHVYDSGIFVLNYNKFIISDSPHS